MCVYVCISVSPGISEEHLNWYKRWEMTNPLWLALCWVCEFFSPTMPLFISISSHHRSNRDLSLPLQTIHLTAARSCLMRLPLKLTHLSPDQTKPNPSQYFFFPTHNLYWIYWNHHIRSNFLNVPTKFWCSLEVKTFWGNCSDAYPSAGSMNNTTKTIGLEKLIQV